MSDIQQASYRQIFKATTLFGGAQIIIIVIGLIRSKFIALLLGTTGFGIASLLNTPLALITTITGLGISYSAIRDISIAHESGDAGVLKVVYNIFRYWMWITGLLGIAITILFAPFLSRWSFGNNTYTYVFVFLSFSLLFTSFSNGQVALLRGTRRLGDAAKSSVMGPILGLVCTLPLYYIGGIQAIPVAIFVTAIITWLSTWFYSKNYLPPKERLSYLVVVSGGKGMIRLGIVMTITGLLTQLVGYLIILFIGNKGGISQVGLYNAGWTITNQYVGVIFAAMSVDYFPRLSVVSKDNQKTKEAVNQQGEIVILLLGPIISIFILLLPWIIKILFTDEFLSVIPFVRWMAIGMLFRAASWVISFVPGAKGDTLFFLIIETIGSIFYLAVSLLGYSWMGLEGIGVFFIFNYVFYWGLVYVAARKRYDFRLTKDFIIIFSVQFLLTGGILVEVMGHKGAFWLPLVLLLVSVCHSFCYLDKRIDFCATIKARIKCKK